MSSLAPVSTDPDDKLSIDIRRECVLRDALREGKKKKFCTKKCLKVIVVISSCSVFTIYLQVTFVDEGAIDAGGPRREFFRLLALEASESSYFCGQDDDKFFSCDVPAVRV